MDVKPVKHIQLSAKDEKFLLETEQNAIQQSQQPNDYTEKIVIKPWGYEFLVFENEYVAIWYLHIHKDHSTSMHCHPLKQTSLAILFGEALCNTFYHRNIVSAGDALLIDAGVFHSTKSLSLDSISVIEVETPPNKTDLVRLADNYGRKQCGYEGYSKMKVNDINKYNHFCFKEKNCHGKRFSIANKFSVSMEKYANNDIFQREFNLNYSDLYCLCRGVLLNRNKNSLLGLGATETGAFLHQQEIDAIAGETVLMKFTIHS